MVSTTVYAALDGVVEGGFVVSSRAAVSRRLVLAMLASLCVALAVLALASASAFAWAPTFVGSFGPSVKPTGMAVEEATGNVLVAESGELERLDVFGERGGMPAGGAPTRLTGENTPAGSFSFKGAIAFNEEWVGVAVDNSTSAAAGSIYVVDPGHAVVDRFKLSGNEFKYESQLDGQTRDRFHEAGRRCDGRGRRCLRERSRREHRTRVLARGHRRNCQLRG